MKLGTLKPEKGMKHTYTIDDLVSRELLDAGANKPAKLAVIGDPVKHSKSPDMHQASLDAQGFEMRYVRVHVETGRVREAFSKMEQLGFIGVNVTVPHKIEALEVCDELTDTAKQMQAVNTIHFKDGKWIGHNTDGPGLANALETELGKSFSNSKTLIIGAGGGAGRAIAIQAALDKCPQLTLANRTVSKLEPLTEQIRSIHPNCDLQLVSNNTTELMSCKAELVINATSLGMQEGDALPFPADGIRNAQVFYDAVYTPPVTPFLANAQERGCKTANGKSMLVHQGALSYAMWLGRKAEIELMTQAIR